MMLASLYSLTKTQVQWPHRNTYKTTDRTHPSTKRKDVATKVLRTLL